MEELRGQLGERLTPAMAIAAKSMGVTTAELEKMVESGISAEAFLPKFGAAMEEAFAGAESAQASVNRLKNQFDELLLKFGEEGGINAAYQKLLDDVGAGLSWIEEKIGSLDGALTGGLSDGLTSAYELIKEVGAEAYEAFGSLMDTINECGNRLKQGLGGSFTGGQTVALARQNLDRACLLDAQGRHVSAEKYSIDLTAGKLTFAEPLSLAGHTLPLTAVLAWEEENRITAADVSGRLKLQTPLTRDYPQEGTYVSSALVGGDLLVRATEPFAQKTWDGVWAEAVRGDPILARLNTAN